jgi:hypothetical protein
VEIETVIWLRSVVDKLAGKHQVDTLEVEEVLSNRPKIRFVEKGTRRGEMSTWPWDKLMQGDTLQYCSFTRKPTRH